MGKVLLTKDSPLLSRREKFVTSELTKVALGVLMSWLSIPRILVCNRPMSSTLPLILSHSMRSPTLKNGLKNKRLMPPIMFLASYGHARATKKKSVSAAGELDAESVSYLLGGQTKGDLTKRERERGARSDADDETRAGTKIYRDEAERSDQGLYGKAECVGKKEGGREHYQSPQRVFHPSKETGTAELLLSGPLLLVDAGQSRVHTCHHLLDQNGDGNDPSHLDSVHRFEQATLLAREEAVKLAKRRARSEARTTARRRRLTLPENPTLCKILTNVKLMRATFSARSAPL